MQEERRGKRPICTIRFRTEVDTMGRYLFVFVSTRYKSTIVRRPQQIVDTARFNLGEKLHCQGFSLSLGDGQESTREFVRRKTRPRLVFR